MPCGGTRSDAASAVCRSESASSSWEPGRDVRARRCREALRDDVEFEDLFGAALAAGNVGLDKRADLVVGVPVEDVGAVVNAGAVNVLYGSGNGLSDTGAQFWHQDP
jgi:hypothetical protein